MVKVLAFSLLVAAACTTNHADEEAVCGDGVTTPGVNGTGEQCDYSDPATSAHCDMSCHLVPYCGDGHLDSGETCDDGNTNPGDGCSATCTIESGGTPSYVISASWTLKLVESSTPQPCPTGFDSAVIYSQKVSASGTAIGAPVIDAFNCNSPGAGITTPLPAGLYDVSLEIQNHALTTTYASTIPARVDLTTSNKTFSADLFTDGGYFSLSWKLVKASDMAMTVTCAQAGVGANGGAEAISTNTDGTHNAVSDLFTCDDAAGITSALPAADYTVSVDVFGNNMTALGTAAPISATIMGPNKVTPLGLVQIPITGL